MRFHKLGMILMAATLLSLGGCGTPSPQSGRPEMLIDRQGIDVVAADYARQFTYFKERGATERYCRGPGPDAITTSSSGVQLGVPTQAGALGEVGSSATRGGVDLGGRNPAVLISRELLYRACELASNINADPATERQIYKDFLDAIVSISKNQVSAGNAALAANPTAPVLPAGAAALPQATQMSGTSGVPGDNSTNNLYPTPSSTTDPATGLPVTP